MRAKVRTCSLDITTHVEECLSLTACGVRVALAICNDLDVRQPLGHAYLLSHTRSLLGFRHSRFDHLMVEECGHKVTAVSS